MIYFRGDLLLGQDLQVLNLIYFRGDLLSDPFLGRLVVLGCEVGGRWYPEALRILGSLAEVKSQEVHPDGLAQAVAESSGRFSPDQWSNATLQRTEVIFRSSLCFV